MTPVLDLRCAAGLQVDESAAVDEGEAGSPRSLRSMSFNLPPELEAGEPPEARGLARDEVRLMVSYRAEDRVLHAQFRDLPCYLSPGDVLVVNTSGTMPAAVPARRADGTELELHLSTRLPGGLWTVEFRMPDPQGSQPYYAAQPGETLALPGGGNVAVLGPYVRGSRGAEPARQRLWLATLRLPLPVYTYLAHYGSPIRYRYVKGDWPVDYYQTVYATETGSAEMPSAGRPFSAELIHASGGEWRLGRSFAVAYGSGEPGRG